MAGLVGVAPNRIWCWDVSYFTRARQVAFAVVDVVSRRLMDTLVSLPAGGSCLHHRRRGG
jgi:hypothetical protein